MTIFEVLLLLGVLVALSAVRVGLAWSVGTRHGANAPLVRYRRADLDRWHARNTPQDASAERSTS